MRYLSLEEIQKAELDILVAFDRLCREHGLRYSLVGGTLLGAVRHKGFIPWDDDIDVAMPRPDYEKLRALLLAPNESEYALKGFPNEEDADPVFSKLVDERIRVKETFLKHDLHLWIDVFPIDGLPSDEKEVEEIYDKANKYRRVLIASYADLSKGKTKFRRFAKNVLHAADKVLPIAKSCKNGLQGLAKKYPYEGSPYVGAISWGLYGPGERLPAGAFSHMVEVEFEGMKFPAMYCWDEYLTGIYGDYMQLPPEDQRVRHEMSVWRASDEQEDEA